MRDLIPFSQFKKSWKTPLEECYFYTLPWVFSRFLNCTNGTKSRKAYTLPYFQSLFHLNENHLKVFTVKSFEKHLWRFVIFSKAVDHWSRRTVAKAFWRPAYQSGCPKIEAKKFISQKKGVSLLLCLKYIFVQQLVKRSKTLWKLPIAY